MSVCIIDGCDLEEALQDLQQNHCYITVAIGDSNLKAHVTAERFLSGNTNNGISTLVALTYYTLPKQLFPVCCFAAFCSSNSRQTESTRYCKTYLIFVIFVSFKQKVKGALLASLTYPCNSTPSAIQHRIDHLFVLLITLK